MVFDQVRPNPTVQNVEAALRRYTAAQCQGLIAFGGGSAMERPALMPSAIPNPSWIRKPGWICPCAISPTGGGCMASCSTCSCGDVDEHGISVAA